MRMSTCLLPKVLFAIALGLALFANQSQVAKAQEESVIPASYQSGSFFNRQLGTALRFNYHTQGYGTQDDVFSLGGMKVFNMDGAAVFLDGQGTLSDDFGGGYNLGVGYRQLATLGTSFDPERIIGAGLWTDGQSSANDNFFAQLGFSLESLGDAYDVRLNGHFPLERTKAGDATLTGTGTPFYLGNNIFGATESFGVDTALDVLDSELAFRINDLEAWAFAGAYYLGGGDDDTAGYRVGMRGYAIPDLAVSLSVTDDDIYDTNVMFGVTWFIGRTHKGNAPCGTLLDRFREPVIRNDFIAMTSERQSRQSGDALTSPDDDEAIRIVHIDSTDGLSIAGGGDGTFENPFSDLDDIDISNTPSSLPGDIILVHSGSTLNGTAILQADQSLFGEGVDLDMNEIPHVIATNELGNISLPETADNSLTGARPIIAAAGGNPITVADNNTVNNFTINNAGTAILADSVTAPTLQNLQINDAATAIALRNLTGGTTVVENTVQINRASVNAIEIDGGADGMSLAAMINATTGNSLSIQNRTGGTIDFTGNIDDTEDEDGNAVATNSTGVLINMNTDTTVNFPNAQDIRVGDGSTGIAITNNTSTAVNTPGDIRLTALVDGQGIEFSGNTNSTFSATGATDIVAEVDSAGVVISGNDVDSNVTFSDLMAIAVDDDTVSIAGDGTVSISSSDDTRTIENTGAGNAFFNDGATGSAIVTVNSNIENSNGGTAVTVNNRADANDITFTGLVDSMGAAGIVADNNSDGNIIFTNTLTLNTATANAVELTGNTGATFSFTDLAIDTTGGSGFLATGGGTLLVTSANGTNVVNVGSGVGVDLTDMTIDSANVTFDEVNVGSGSGIGINLQNLDGTGQVAIGGGTDPGDGGTLVTAGTAINVSNADDVLLTNMTVSNGGAAQGVVVANQSTGSQAVFNGLDVNTADGIGVTIGDMALVLSNTDGAITFSDLTVSTIGDGDGIVVSNDDASTATININNVAVDIRDTDTDSNLAKGFVATGGGTITMSGTNTIDSDAATAFEATDVESLTASNVTINNTAAAGVVVTGQSDATDTVTLTNFDVTTTTADAVTVDTNTNGTINLNNLTAESGTGDTVVLTNNTGATVNVNGMTVEATGSGAAFTATGGGTLSAIGTNNVTANTGSGVDIQNMTIGGTDVTFASVDVTNAGGTAINLDTLTGGQVAVNGGTLTGNAAATGAGIVVNDVDDASLAGVTVDYSASTQAGLLATNSAGDTLAVSNLDVTTSAGNGVDVTGGTFGATGTNSITSTTGTGLSIVNSTIAGTGAAFNTVDVNGATNGIVLTNATGGQIRVGGAAATGTDGAGGTLVTSGTAIVVTGVTNAVFNDVSTEVTGAFQGVEVTHTTAANSSVLFNNLTHTTSGTGGGVQVTDNGTGELDFTLRNSSLDVDAADSFGFNLVTGNNAGQIDIRLDDNLIIAANNSAVSADINAGTGSIQFLVSGGNDWTNNSAASATANFALNVDRTLNATIGDQTGVAPFDENRFINSNAGGTAFAAESNSAGATLSLDLRGNNASGGAIDYLLTETLGTFGVVDRTATITTETNNAGSVDLGGGGVEADFDDLGAGPIQQVD